MSGSSVTQTAAERLARGVLARTTSCDGLPDLELPTGAWWATCPPPAIGPAGTPLCGTRSVERSCCLTFGNRRPPRSRQEVSGSTGSCVFLEPRTPNPGADSSPGLVWPGEVAVTLRSRPSGRAALLHKERQDRC